MDRLGRNPQSKLYEKKFFSVGRDKIDHDRWGWAAGTSFVFWDLLPPLERRIWRIAGWTFGYQWFHVQFSPRSIVFTIHSFSVVGLFGGLKQFVSLAEAVDFLTQVAWDWWCPLFFPMPNWWKVEIATCEGSLTAMPYSVLFSFHSCLQHTSPLNFSTYVSDDKNKPIGEWPKKKKKDLIP